MAHPKPRKWFPKNPEKYVGDVNNIVARSSYEIKFLNYCDDHPEILKYSSEELVIPYYSPVDNKMHRYFVDFLIAIRTQSGEIKRYAVEIKPFFQTEPPKNREVSTKKQKKRLMEETMTFSVNQAKWNAAKEFCRKKGMDFIVLTEKELFK